MSPELSIMLSPARAYARMAEHPSPPGRLVVAVRRPAFVALFLACVVTMSATGRVSAPTVASVGLYWIFATIVQAAAAAALVAYSPARRVSAPRAIDLLFMAQGPWAIWLLGLAAWSSFASNPADIPGVAIATAPVPAVWTGVLLFTCCRIVLQAPPRAALARTFLHQTAIWSFTAAYISMAVQVWPRVLGVLSR